MIQFLYCQKLEFIYLFIDCEFYEGRVNVYLVYYSFFNIQFLVYIRYLLSVCEMNEMLLIIDLFIIAKN